MMKTIYGLLLAGLSAIAQTATAPLIIERSAPIVELEFRAASGTLRMAVLRWIPVAEL
jgi:hypothetical protein